MQLRKLCALAIFGILANFQLVEGVCSREIFAKYPNASFIESGSCEGAGVQNALDAGFQNIYSIELAPHFYQHCCRRFRSNPNVKLYQGDSTHVLPVILKQIDAPATFWLDGHYSWGKTARGATNSPILAELESIRAHHIKTHTILIDDVRQFGTIEFDFIELDEIIQKILQINPNYTISFEDGLIPKDVLIAQIK